MIGSILLLHIMFGEGTEDQKDSARTGDPGGP